MKLLKPQILNFNRRNMDMENKNVLILLPCSSPMKKHKHLDQDSTTLYTLSPVMTGYSKTVKNFSVAWKDENVKSADERKEEILINRTFSPKNQVDLLKELYEFEIA